MNGNNIQKDTERENTTIIGIEGLDGPFGSAELMLSLFSASQGMLKETMDSLGLVADGYQNSESLFNTLGNLEEGMTDEVWWTLYIPFFKTLAESEHMEAFWQFINQSDSKDYEKWMEENEDKMKAFEKWWKKNKP